MEIECGGDGKRGKGRGGGEGENRGRRKGGRRVRWGRELVRRKEGADGERVRRREGETERGEERGRRREIVTDTETKTVIEKKTEIETGRET